MLLTVAHPSARVLVVDDEPPNVRLLEEILRQAGYNFVTSVTDAREAIRRFIDVEPDVVLLDLRMPHLDGYAIIRALKPVAGGRPAVPVVALTADDSPEARRRALASGANDFVTKPFDRAEILLRVGNLLETRFLMLSLDTQVKERTHDLERTRAEIIERLARAAEYRDDATGRHTARVARGVALLATAAGVSNEEIALLHQASQLHDVGKIGVPDRILLKPGPLTTEERTAMQRHTVIGGEILSGAQFPLLKLAAEIALTHHERWDGEGYMGLAGTEAPVSGRITAIIDAFDALTHTRPYRGARPVAAALSEIERERGRHFDPDLAAAFARLPHHELI